MSETKMIDTPAGSWQSVSSKQLPEQGDSSHELATTIPVPPECVKHITVELGKLIAKHLASDESRPDSLNQEEDRRLYD